MALNNPAFTRNEAFSEKGGTAAANTAASTAGLSAAQLQAMYNQPSANAVDTDRMTIDDTIVKSTVSFIVLLIGRCSGLDHGPADAVHLDHRRHSSGSSSRWSTSSSVNRRRR